MRIKNSVIFVVALIALAGSSLLAGPVTLTMDDLTQIGGIQQGNNNNLGTAITLSGIEDLNWAGGSFDTSYLWVWDYNQGLFWWWGPGEVTHLSVKAGNYWILYELETPLQAGGFIYLDSEIFNKKGEALSISHVTGYSGTVNYDNPPTESVPEPATFLLMGLGLLAVPGFKKIMAA